MMMTAQQPQLSLDLLPSDWPKALCGALSAKGFATATAYADSRPTASLDELADELGPEVTPIQVERKLVVEAEESATIERCARSLLARVLRSALPEGWPREWKESTDDEDCPLFRRAGAFLSLEMALPESCEGAVNRIRRVMDTADIPSGWLPSGPDDLILIEAFSHWSVPTP
jgi:hypothetical protein